MRYSKQLLSASTDGRAILVQATDITSSPTLIHEAHATALDLVTMYVTNNATVDVALTVGFGGTTDPNDLIRATVPARAGLALVCWKQPIRNSLDVVAAASVANVLSIIGSVDRISP
ncbi:MAG: hypothetical protein KatS3mg015_2547 [Fimbriimonadales bacterium]|nr:MAG: hypothetical protein KatS3mg015_2547 [Fimbriimonadales bacterium]